MAGAGCPGWGQRPNSPKTGTRRCRPVSLSSPTVTQTPSLPRLPAREFPVKPATAQADRTGPGKVEQQRRPAAFPTGGRHLLPRARGHRGYHLLVVSAVC